MLLVNLVLDVSAQTVPKDLGPFLWRGLAQRLHVSGLPDTENPISVYRELTGFVVASTGPLGPSSLGTVARSMNHTSEVRFRLAITWPACWWRGGGPDSPSRVRPIEQLGSNSFA